MTETINATNTTTTKDEGNLLNAYEAAEFLRISYWHLMDLVRRKKIPHIRFSKRVFFRQSSLQRYIEELEANSMK